MLFLDRYKNNRARMRIAEKLSIEGCSPLVALGRRQMHGMQNSI